MQIMDGYDMMRGGYWILWLILYILVLIGVILLIKYLHKKKAAKMEPESALEILKKRYSRVEINKEESERKRNT